MARNAVVTKSKTVRGAASKKVPVRRTNAERSEQTRERVLSAAVHVLCTSGYSGATTLAIQDAAGMSLGALQHQFPTKAKLMAAVLERFAEHRFNSYDEAARAASDPIDGLRRILDVTGDIIRDPVFVSGIEILLAKRNEPALEAELAPLIKRYDDQMWHLLEQFARDSGVGEGLFNRRTLALANAVAHGLAMELVTSKDRASVAGAFAMWREMALNLFTQEIQSNRKGNFKKG